MMIERTHLVGDFQLGSCFALNSLSFIFVRVADLPHVLEFRLRIEEMSIFWIGVSCLLQQSSLFSFTIKKLTPYQLENTMQ